MKFLLFIALGGASGAVARFVVANYVHQLWEGHVPVGTLLVKRNSFTPTGGGC